MEPNIGRHGQGWNQVKLLKNYANLVTAHACAPSIIHRPDVHTINCHNTAVRLIEASNNVEQCTFTTARFACESKCFASRQKHLDTPQNRQMAIRSGVRLVQIAYG